MVDISICMEISSLVFHLVKIVLPLEIYYLGGLSLLFIWGDYLFYLPPPPSYLKNRGDVITELGDYTAI